MKASKIIVWVFNTPLSTMGKSSRQNINKETQYCRLKRPNRHTQTFHPTTTVEYTYFLSAHRTFSRIYVRLQNKS